MPQRSDFRLVASLALAGAIGCASAPISKTATVELARADKLVGEGCYDCLTDALAIYERIAVGKARPLVVERMFETNVLLGLRLKELAERPAEPFARAKALIAELPPAYPAARYLEIADAVPSDPGGGMPKRDVLTARLALNPPRLKAFQADLAAAPGNTLAQYLSASLDCTVPAPVTPLKPTDIVRAPGAALNAPAPPARSTLMTLVQFRRANCASIDRDALAKLATDDPRYIEAGVFVGRVRSLRPGALELRDARVWLTAAAARWPRSAAVSYGLGVLNQTAGDCRAAVDYYEKTLKEYGEHEDAHLGRLMCLSYLARHDAAIEEASGMIFQKINEGEAYYWRAWNYREMQNLAAARLDSNRMKALLFNGRALTLAGQIEYDMGDLPVAEQDLTDAVRLGRGENCVAQWYWSLVQLKREAWAPTADGFGRAMTCYDVDRGKNVGYLEEMKKMQNVDEDWRQGQLANFQALIAEDDGQISASAFNAAVNYARAQNREKAFEYLDIAAKDPARAAQVEELRKLIVK